MEEKYAAELLFYYDKSTLGEPQGKIQLLEKKIWVFSSGDKDAVYDLAMAKGLDEEFIFSDGPVDVEYKFLGVRQLMSLEGEDEDIAWWEYDEVENPAGRKSDFIPDKSELKIYQPSSGRGKLTLL